MGKWLDDYTRFVLWTSCKRHTLIKYCLQPFKVLILTDGEIWGSQGDRYEDGFILGCSFKQSDRYWPTFHTSCLHHQDDAHPRRHQSSVNKCLHRNVCMFTYVNWTVDSMMTWSGFLLVRLHNELCSCYSSGGVCVSHTHELLVPLHLMILLITDGVTARIYSPGSMWDISYIKSACLIGFVHTWKHCRRCKQAVLRQALS